MERVSEKERKMLEFVEATNAGKRMLQRKAKAFSTKLEYCKAALLLTEFLGKPIDDIVNEYVADAKAGLYEASDKWEEQFSEFATWLKEVKGYGSSSSAVYHAGAKSLINANVPRRMRIMAETPEHYSKTIAGVPMDELKQIYAACDERERAYIAILKDSGISADDALRLNYGDLKGFEKDDFVHISITREKEHVEYGTFIGPNSVEALRAFTLVRRRRGEVIEDSTPIFVTTTTPYNRLYASALFQVFARLEKKTGLTISSHRLRKFFETYMALTVRHPIILKFWMGHKVAKSGDIEAKYIIPPIPEQLELYKQAYKQIDLTQAGMEERVKAVEQILEGMTPEQKELMQKHGIQMRERAHKRKDCPDGEHCGEAFEQISETQLLGYLRQGWSLVHRLESGEIIVRK